MIEVQLSICCSQSTSGLPVHERHHSESSAWAGAISRTAASAAKKTMRAYMASTSYREREAQSIATWRGLSLGVTNVALIALGLRARCCLCGLPVLLMAEHEGSPAKIASEIVPRVFCGFPLKAYPSGYAFSVSSSEQL